MSAHGQVSPYDAIACLYDRWNTSVVEDIAFYVEEAISCAGPVLELGVGTGRIAVPIAQAGVPVIGIDSSLPMLERCRERARAAGVEALCDLRLGDVRSPPVSERVPLVISPFRTFLHLLSEDDRLLALAHIHRLLEPGGRLVFDVFAPSPEDIAETHGRWIEREPGIEEKAEWDPQKRTLFLSVRGQPADARMQLAWISAQEWLQLLERANLQPQACYGWFDRRPHSGQEDMVFVARRK